VARGILTINAGSSSIKFALFELDGGLGSRPVVSGQIDGIGAAASRIDLQVIPTNEEWMIAHHAQVLLGL
jgi:acetate kinase